MTATSEAAQSAFDYFTAGNAAMKKNFERSVAAFAEMNSYSKQNFEALVASMTAAAKGAETVGTRAVAFSKKTVEAQVEATKSLAGAKSLKEVMELQNAYAKTALKSFLAEATEVSDAMATTVKDAVAPLNARATAIVEKISAAH